jgi:3-amino-4-hydroxybenzoic acid synthase
MEKAKKLKREVWLDGRQIPISREDIWSFINNSNLSNIVVTLEQSKNLCFPLKTKLITEITNLHDLEEVPQGQIVLGTDYELLEKAKQKGYSNCMFYNIAGQDALEKASREADNFDFVVIDFDLPTNIPLELILAKLQQSKTIILKRETTFEAAEVAFGVMERGSDGVVLVTDDLNEIIEASDYLTSQSEYLLKLQTLVVEEISHIGMGLRACIDTTGIMTQEEGMLIGSTSAGGIFVCSETHYLPYMNLRPFRVNAGAVHSYIWMPNDTAEYLTDLKAGSKVLCVNTKGEARELTVGRVKMEVRPLLLIKGKADQVELNVIVQDDWHIRLMGANGEPKNATTIRSGDKLLSFISTPGRHVGIRVAETIIER